MLLVAAGNAVVAIFLWLFAFFYYVMPGRPSWFFSKFADNAWFWASSWTTLIFVGSIFTWKSGTFALREQRSAWESVERLPSRLLIYVLIIAIGIIPPLLTITCGAGLYWTQKKAQLYSHLNLKYDHLIAQLNLATVPTNDKNDIRGMPRIGNESFSQGEILVVERDIGSQFRLSDNFWLPGYSIPPVPSKVRIIVAITKSKVFIRSYSPSGQRDYQSVFDVSLLRWPDGTCIGNELYEGAIPPNKSGSPASFEDFMGEEPWQDVRALLLRLEVGKWGQQ